MNSTRGFFSGRSSRWQIIVKQKIVDDDYGGLEQRDTIGGMDEQGWERLKEDEETLFFVWEGKKNTGHERRCRRGRRPY